MILYDKTKEVFGYEFKNARQLDHVCVKCDVCGSEYSKSRRDTLTWSGKCVTCFSKVVGKMMGDTYGKAQKVKGNCIECSVPVRSTHKRCKPCGDKFAKERMIGELNPAWTGDHVCGCGKKKSFGAARCRDCSFADGKRSGDKNGRFIKENREYVLECRKVRLRLSGLMNNTCNSLGFIKNYRKTKDILGYTWLEFKLHLESKFQPGMSWDNHGEWHIDHIVPVAWFIRNKCFDPKVVNALSNLRPLWAKENLMKRDKIDESNIDLIRKIIGEA